MDWLAGIFELCGSWLVGSKNRWGFVANFIGCCLWVWVAFDYRLYGLLLIVIPALGFNIRNFIKWSK
jgi:hypothetical protein